MRSEQLYGLLQSLGIRKLKSEHSGYIMGCCPLHDDNSPSFGVSVTPPYFAHCFVCGWMPLEKVVAHCKGFYRKGKHGEIIYDYERAKNWLREKFGVTYQQTSERSRNVPRYDEVYRSSHAEGQKHPFQLPEYRIAKFRGGKATHESFFDRGFTKRTAKLFCVGFDKEFRRITIPIRWRDGTLAGVVGRRTEESETIQAVKTFTFQTDGGAIRRIKLRQTVPNPKYYNYTGEDLGEPGYVFDSGRILFPLHLFKKPSRDVLKRAGERLRQRNFVVLVEGPFDAIRLHQMGLTNALCIFGSKITEFQLKTILSLGCDAIVSMLDNPEIDEAGASGLEKLIERARGRIPVYLVEYPPNKKDPGECTDAEIWKMLRKSRIYFRRSIDRLT